MTEKEMPPTWKAEYRKLVADYNALVDTNEELRAAIGKFLCCPFVKGENGLVLTMNWADIEALDKEYRKACGYDD